MTSSFGIEADLYNDLTQRLDNIAVRSLEITEDILSERIALDNEMKEAFINMAKTRYNMGNWTVGRNQLPTEDSDVEPMFRVKNEKDGNGFEYSLISSSSKEKFTDERNAVRRRNVKGSGIESFKEIQNNTGVVSIGEEVSGFVSDNTNAFEFDFDDQETDESESTTSVKSLSNKNPLNWFGVLIPGSLRQSQEGFQRSLSHLCRIASMQSQLLNMQTEYKKLIRQKQQLKNPYFGE